MRVLLAALATFAAPVAVACDPYDTGALLSDLVSVEDALRNGDGTTAGRVAGRMQIGLPCLGEPLPYMIVGRVFRGIGAGYYASGQEAVGTTWFLTALEVDPTFDYGTEDLPIGSPIRTAYMDSRANADVDPESPGGVFAPGRWYLDGSVLGSPRATPGRPHLLQRQADGAVSGWLVQGTSFPPEAVVSTVAANPTTPTARPPRERPDRPAREPEATTPRPTPTTPGRTPTGGTAIRLRPWEKTPLMVGGGVAIAGAGALYYLSSVSRGNFDDSATEADMKKHAAATNRFVIASAAVFAVGAGTLTWGVVLDGGGAVPVVGLRF